MVADASEDDDEDTDDKLIRLHRIRKGRMGISKGLVADIKVPNVS